MATRPSNLARNRWTVSLLDPRPDARVLELGFGPGVALAALAARVTRGRIVGIDHSPLMVRRAARRNAAAIAQGRMELLAGSAEHLPALGEPFDAVMAVNVAQFWTDPVAVLQRLRGQMRPGGRIALTVQPRNPRAGEADVQRLLTGLPAQLGAAGFTAVRVERLALKPVDAVCALAQA
jgi:ubiquinone/menaquinone biosynthesis C-methylase UbiE